MTCERGYMVKPVGNGQIVSSLYTAAIDTTTLPIFLEAWDEYVLNPALMQKADILQSQINSQTLYEHAKRALEIFEINKKSGPRTIKEFISSKKHAVFVASMEGKVMAANDFAKSKFALAKDTSVFDIPIDAKSLANLSSFMRRPQMPSYHHEDKLLPLQIIQKDGATALVIVEFMPRYYFVDCEGAGVLFFKSCVAEWTDVGAQLIKESFDYTKAELEVLQLFCEGQNIKDIATMRQRSIETIKKQTKTLLQKAGVHSQSELIRIMTGVLHLCTKSEIKVSETQTNWRIKNRFQRIETLSLGNNQNIQFVHYGAKNGIPFLFIQSNTSPLPSRRFVNAVADEGLQIIAPFKPGAGETSPDTKEFNPLSYFRKALRIMEHFGFLSVYLAGHCMGGVYCIDGAYFSPLPIKGIVLVDTGAPIQSRETILAMPPTAKRTFLAARETQDILYTPYAIASDLFFQSQEGRKTIIDLAYKDSKIDTEALKNTTIAKVVENNLSYTLSDPKRSADDLIFWMIDWTPAYDRLVKTIPVLFVHGEQHDWLSAGDVEKFCNARKNAKAEIIPGVSQLGLYQKPEAFAKAMASILVKAV